MFRYVIVGVRPDVKHQHVRTPAQDKLVEVNSGGVGRRSAFTLEEMPDGGPLMDDAPARKLGVVHAAEQPNRAAHRRAGSHPPSERSRSPRRHPRRSRLASRCRLKRMWLIWPRNCARSKISTAVDCAQRDVSIRTATVVTSSGG